MIIKILLCIWIAGYYMDTSLASEVLFTLGPLGQITGKTTQTKYFLDPPHSNRPYYKLRNIPYIEGSMSGENIF